MIELEKRLGVMAEIVKERSGLGKTAMMKYIFILQQVFKVPLGYDYEIYTYGPYSSEVMQDIQLAADYDVFEIHETIFSNGHYGYRLEPSAKTTETINVAREFVQGYISPIHRVVELFGHKSAKELELSSTIIYVYHNHLHNGWEITNDKVSNSVHRIKPHFSLQDIQLEYEDLQKENMLQIS